jgi:hypothetical protein
MIPCVVMRMKHQGKLTLQNRLVDDNIFVILKSYDTLLLFKITLKYVHNIYCLLTSINSVLFLYINCHILY